MLQNDLIEIGSKSLHVQITVIQVRQMKLEFIFI